MPSATKTTNTVAMTSEKEVQLIYLCCLLVAIDKSCQALHQVKYVSGTTTSTPRLEQFPIFLNQLALICDKQKGGDTITALVALKASNGPAYYFASNNRQEEDLIDTKTFLTKLLDYVGTNPDQLGERPLQKQVLWRILEFNYPRIDYYIKSLITANSNCIAQRTEPVTPAPTSDMIKQLIYIGGKAQFSRDMLSGANAKPKFLKDCESLIKAIQAFKDAGFSKELDELANGANSDNALPWCELRHFFARLHAYRRASEEIVTASKEWPAVFTGFSVNYMPSARSPKFSMPKITPSLEEVIRVAFPDMELRSFQHHIEQLCEYGLYENIKHEMRQRSIKRVVHTEILLQDFLVQNNFDDPEEYWRDTMFIATSKPPCRLCHHYFEALESEFKIQSPHMNTYVKWRLPDIYKKLGGVDTSEAFQSQQTLMETIIERMQKDILRICSEKTPEGPRNDSRTWTRTGSSTMVRPNEERSHSRTSGGQSTGSNQPFKPLGSLAAQIGTTSGLDDFHIEEEETEDDEFPIGKAL